MNFVVLVSCRNGPVPAELSFLQSFVGILGTSDDANVVMGYGLDTGNGQCGSIGIAFYQRTAHLSRFGHIAIDGIGLIWCYIKERMPLIAVVYEDDDLFLEIIGRKHTPVGNLICTVSSNDLSYLHDSTITFDATINIE